jgi:antitoxin YefM
MQVISSTEARNNFKKVFDSVYYDNDEVIIHRKDKENVVLISMSEYNSMQETDYLLASKTNREHLLESIKQVENGEYFERELIECD